MTTLGALVKMNIDVSEAKIENAFEISTLTSEICYLSDEEKTKEWLGYLLKSEAHCVFIELNSYKSVCGWIVVESAFHWGRDLKPKLPD